ncbi:flagellar hook-basal body protein FliE [Herbaspirillum rubrisubalbicans]|uniref:flagellar hook-basal body complex protein FliE n=1 Tax=Herbaspirillum rubrisubalbicans TaxID=80842 RepID=UPI000DC297C0|nr:flagellar hook-basal body complex protein FliE [Herbaspirillum rubrisubalbicans]RAN48431.1 flagellar hook-basal body protein FliE [Herbaspirillum rubrisubalbicans]
MDSSALQAVEALLRDSGVQREALLQPAAIAPAGQESFGQMVSTGIESVNQQLMLSQTDLQQLATGNVENLHQVMIRLEQTRLSFSLLMQIRNRVLESYQDVMKMQV